VDDKDRIGNGDRIGIGIPFDYRVCCVCVCVCVCVFSFVFIFLDRWKSPGAAAFHSGSAITESSVHA
jgi:hypothetical protein